MSNIIAIASIYVVIAVKPQYGALIDVLVGRMTRFSRLQRHVVVVYLNVDTELA